MINSICIVRLSALGDAIMLVPMVRTLQKYYPKAKITWIIANPAYKMLQGLSGVEFILIDKPKGFKDYWQFWRKMRNRKFDVLLAPQASLRTNLLYPLIIAHRKIGYDKARANDGHRLFVKESIDAAQEHTLEGFLRFAKHLGCSEPVIDWQLPLRSEDTQWANQHKPQGRVLVINPAASKQERAWPSERYIELIHRAQERWQLSIVLTGGPSDYEKGLADEIKANCKVVDLVGKTQPKQLIALLEQVEAVVCPDTGPAHMATAVKTPVVGLYAVNPPHISGPYLSQELVVDKYPQAVKTILGKDMSKVSWTTRVHSPLAMQLIEVEDVMAKLEGIFG